MLAAYPTHPNFPASPKTANLCCKAQHSQSFLQDSTKSSFPTSANITRLSCKTSRCQCPSKI
jgi:hypothetical protein